MPRAGKCFSGSLWGWVLLLTVSGLCFVSSAPAQNTQWIPSQITDCDNCTITNLHFDTLTTGWAIGFLPPPSRDWLLFRTNDGGTTWKPESIPYTQYLIYQRSRFLNPLEGWSPADSPMDVDRVIANRGHNPGEDNAVEGPVRFYHTGDGGNSWDLRSGTVTGFTDLGNEVRAKNATRRYFTAIRFLTPTVGILAGQLWEYREDENGKPLFMQWRGRAIYTTQDGGDTWHAFRFGDNFDSWNDWRRCLGAFPFAIADIEAVDGRYAWIPALACSITGVHYLFTTTDGGRSWEVIETSGVSMFSDQLEFVTPTEGWSWASGGGPTGGSRVTRTKDGGRTWMNAENIPGPTLLFISPQEGWALGGSVADDGRAQGNIQHTLDGGQTWQVEYRTPKEQGVTRWEILDELKYDIATQVIWVYGFRALLRRGDIVTDVSPKGKLPVRWGALKKGE